jgi:hypothetical protein
MQGQRAVQTHLEWEKIAWFSVKVSFNHVLSSNEVIFVRDKTTTLSFLECQEPTAIIRL